MADGNQNHDWQASERGSLDGELDGLLKKYAAVEPRTGLEERVLANLRAEGEHVPDRARWRWSVVSAVTLAAMVLVVTLAWRASTQRSPVIADHPLTATPVVEQPGSRVASNEAAPRPTRKPVIGRTHPVAVVESHPKLDQFPSPHPLSEQEKILASYVDDYPDYAVLVARARTDALRRDELEEMKAAFPLGNRTPDSEERNNDTTER